MSSELVARSIVSFPHVFIWYEKSIAKYKLNTAKISCLSRDRNYDVEETV